MITYVSGRGLLCVFYGQTVLIEQHLLDNLPLAALGRLLAELRAFYE